MEIKKSDIKMQGRMTVEEILNKMESYDGKAAPCDHKYKTYEGVDTPKVDIMEFLSDLRDLLKAVGNETKVGSQDNRKS